MVVDTSAVAAIVFGEPDADLYKQALGTARDPVMSVVTFVECAMVLESRIGPAGGTALDRLVSGIPIDIVAVDRDQADVARLCFRQFGRGRHPAALNFGDCFAYALAKTARRPLLFKGSDFSQTDIPAVRLQSFRA